MKSNRHVVASLAGALVVLAGAGGAVAGNGDAGARCEERLAKIAERRGVSVEQLEAEIKAHLIARIDAAERAGRISSERAAKLRQRVNEATLCGPARRAQAEIAAGGMLRAAARFLGLDRAELRAQLPGTSLAALAEEQGKSVAALKAAMLAPGKARLARAVAAGRITQQQANAALERLEKVAARLSTKVWPKR